MAMKCGGWKERAPEEYENEDIQGVVKFAMDYINGRSNSIEKMTLAKIRSVKTQVVAGMNYMVELEVNLPGGSPPVHTLKIYRDLKGDHSVSDFKVGE